MLVSNIVPERRWERGREGEISKLLESTFPPILGEMIDKLTLTYNRTRQAVITRELIEIISGAAAV